MLNRYRIVPVHNCRPIKIRREDSDRGSRIGGNAPEGIVPPVVNSLTRYFATVELDDVHELSLFLSMDYDEGSVTSLWENAVKVHTADCPLVQLVVQPRANRSSSPYLASELSGHALEIADQIPDIVVQPKASLVLPNKIGGRPYFYYDNPKYIASVSRLFDEGLFLLLQFTCPSSNEAPKGEWPFFELTFHLLAKETDAGILWRYGWG